MKKFALLLLVASTTLAGCVAYPVAPPHDQRNYSDRDRDRDGVPNRYDRDRDGDGVPNRYDNRPGNPRQY